MKRTYDTKEIWKPAEGYENFYQVSNYGRVKSIDRTETCKDGVVRFRKGKVLKPHQNYNGYLWVSFCTNDIRKKKKIHRLVAQCFIPNPDGKPQVNHIDGDKHNNHVDNLEWVTPKENAHHAIENNLTTLLRGEKSPTNKLSSENVLEIRSFINEGVTVKELAKKYSVHTSTIYRIKHDKSWSWLKG